MTSSAEVPLPLEPTSVGVGMAGPPQAGTETVAAANLVRILAPEVPEPEGTAARQRTLRPPS